MVSPGSWVLRFEESESEHGIQPFVRASIHIPDQTADQERRESRKGVGGWGEGRGGDGAKQRERPHEYAGKARVPSVRVN